MQMDFNSPKFSAKLLTVLIRQTFYRQSFILYVSIAMTCVYWYVRWIAIADMHTVSEFGECFIREFYKYFIAYKSFYSTIQNI